MKQYFENYRNKSLPFLDVKYGVYLDSQYCCGGLFVDDIVLVAPSKQALKKILNMVHEWAIKNEMAFRINKCATLVVKPINFVKPINCEVFLYW